MRKLWHLYNDLCEMPLTVCWPNYNIISTRWSSSIFFVSLLNCQLWIIVNC